MEKITGGEAVVKMLEKYCIDRVFCVPGESYLDVLDSLHDHPTISTIATRHESGSSFMAEAYAVETGSVGVCMATRGPGACNLSIGIHTAKQDSTPLIAMIGQVDRNNLGKENYQEVDLVSFYRDVSKWSVEVESVERIPEILDKAFHIAQTGRPGPVVISYPEDLLSDLFNYQETSKSQYLPPATDETTAEQISEMLSSSKYPIVIAGDGVNRAKAIRELEEFSETNDLPVATAFRRYNSFPNSHHNYIGWLGFGCSEDLQKYIRESDLILAIGTRLSSVTTSGYTLPNDKAKIIHVDIDPTVINNTYEPIKAVISDAKKFLKEMLKYNATPSTKNIKEKIKELRENYIDFTTPKKEYSNETVNMNGLMYDFNNIVPKDSLIASDAGNFFSWISKYVRFEHGKKYLGPTVGAMGYGLPAAIGAKLADPNRNVISFCGDGGFMMTIQEMETAVRENLSIIVIVINNSLYGTIKTHQERRFPNRPIATQLGDLSYADIANSFGWKGFRICKNTDFPYYFEKSLKLSGPKLLEVVTEKKPLAL